MRGWVGGAGWGGRAGAQVSGWVAVCEGLRGRQGPGASTGSSELAATTIRGSAAQHDTEQHDTAQRSAARRSTSQQGTTQHSTAQHSAAQSTRLREEPRPGARPEGKGSGCQRHNTHSKPPSHRVRQALHRSRARLRLLHQASHLSDGSVAGGGRRAHRQAAVVVGAASRHGVPCAGGWWGGWLRQRAQRRARHVSRRGAAKVTGASAAVPPLPRLPPRPLPHRSSGQQQPSLSALATA